MVWKLCRVCGKEFETFVRQVFCAPRPIKYDKNSCGWIYKNKFRKRKYKGRYPERWVKRNQERRRVNEFKMREERRTKGLCPNDGRKLEGAYLNCEKCRARNTKRNKTQRRIEWNRKYGREYARRKRTKASLVL